MIAIYHSPITKESFSTDKKPIMIDKMINNKLKTP